MLVAVRVPVHSNDRSTTDGCSSSTESAKSNVEGRASADSPIVIGRSHTVVGMACLHRTPEAVTAIAKCSGTKEQNEAALEWSVEHSAIAMADCDEAEVDDDSDGIDEPISGMDDIRSGSQPGTEGAGRSSDAARAIAIRTISPRSIAGNTIIA